MASKLPSPIVYFSRIGYELPESGSFRAGYAQVDSTSTLLSLVGDFSGLYSFDLVSGKKKKRNFAEHGSCIYSSPSGSVVGSLPVCCASRLATSGDALLFDFRMSKTVGVINSFLCTTQNVLRIVLSLLPPSLAGSSSHHIGSGLPPKEADEFSLPPRQGLRPPHARDPPLLPPIPLQSRLPPTARRIARRILRLQSLRRHRALQPPERPRRAPADLRASPFPLFSVVRESGERNDHRVRDEFGSLRARRRLHSRRNPHQRAATRLDGFHGSTI